MDTMKMMSKTVEIWAIYFFMSCLALACLRLGGPWPWLWAFCMTALAEPQGSKHDSNGMTSHVHVPRKRFDLWMWTFNLFCGVSVWTF
jgi:hypothetical protein